MVNLSTPNPPARVGATTERVLEVAEPGCSAPLMERSSPVSSTTLPMASTDHQDETVSPIQYLEGLFAHHGIRMTRRQCVPIRDTSSRPSFEEIDAYSMETTLAVRTGDLAKLKELYHDKGYSLSACNRFGESILHISCRRGHAKMVEFMMSEAKVNPRVIDDMGRTAFHDVCWSSQPNLETMDVLLRVLPPIGLLLQDARGHTPLNYAPRKHWGVWLQYLREREDIFVNWIRTKKERAVLYKKQQQQLSRVEINQAA